MQTSDSEGVLVNRRNLIAAVGASSILIPDAGWALTTSTPVAETSGRDLVTHVVADGLRDLSPLEIFSSFRAMPIGDWNLIRPNDGEIGVSQWSDLSHPALENTFAAFLITSPDKTIGAIRIFDTPDIAWHGHKPVVDEQPDGFVHVGGMRASRTETEDGTVTSLRLWNVIIDALDEDGSTVVAMGIVKHLGTVIGVL